MLNPFTTLPKLIRSKPAIDALEKDVKTMNSGNWRTTVCGVIAALVSLAGIWAPPAMQAKVQATAVALAGIGLYKASDSKPN